MLLLGSTLAFAQEYREATPDEASAVLARVDEAASFEGRLTADFTLIKRSSMLEEDLVSKGHMVLDSPSTLLWEYISPTAQSTTIDLNSNNKFAFMSRKGDFSRSVYAGKGEWKICLKPLKRDLRQMFSTIEVWMDDQTGHYKKVVMSDTAGDTTTILFSNVRD